MSCSLVQLLIQFTKSYDLVCDIQVKLKVLTLSHLNHLSSLPGSQHDQVATMADLESKISGSIPSLTTIWSCSDFFERV